MIDVPKDDILPRRIPTRRRRRWLWIVTVVLGLPVAGGVIGYVSQFGSNDPPGASPYPHVSSNTSLGSLTSHPAFDGFGPMMNPFEPGPVTALTSPLALDRTMGYLSWDAAAIVDGVNFVIDQVNAGTAVYVPLYDATDAAADSSKTDSGLLLFPGDAGSRTAIVMAGGGWRAQANLQEAFPLARMLNAEGYTVAVVRYRIGVHPDDPASDDDPTKGRKAAVQRAQEDLAAAVTLLHQNADEWNIGLTDYSIWGSSAGAQLAMQWGSDNPHGAGSESLPDPAAIMAAYPPDYFWSPQTEYPPLFVITAANDTVVPVAGTDRMVAGLEENGFRVQYRRLDTGGHGFGIGIGTEAEGWVEEAIAFWTAAATAGAPQ